MQEHIRLLLERAKRTEDRFTLSGKNDSSTLLGEEVVRWAHLATSTHMLLSARETASSSTISLETPVRDVSQLHLSQQEQTS